MNEPMNPQSASGASTEKTFTQEDVNRIVQERLNKERSRTNSELESSFTQREKELEKREFMMTAKESISRAGLPAELIDVLDKSSPEAFEKALHVRMPEAVICVPEYEPELGAVIHLLRKRGLLTDDALNNLKETYMRIKK